MKKKKLIQFKRCPLCKKVCGIEVLEEGEEDDK